MLATESLTPLGTAGLEKHIATYRNFPRSGITFKDITPLLGNPPAFRELIQKMAVLIKQSGAESLVGLDARGFILGAALAFELRLPFVPIRKPGKLPGEVAETKYTLEYGSGALQIQRGSLSPGTKVAIVDDLLATGGSAHGARVLIEAEGATVVGAFFAIELPALKGREVLKGLSVNSILSF